MNNRQISLKKQIRKRFTSILFCFLACGSVLFLTAQNSMAERRYSLSGQLDISGGATNSLQWTQQSGSFAQQELHAYYAVSPSLDLKTEGRNFDLDLGYGFSYNHYDQTAPLTTRSHYVRGQFSSNLSENLHLSISNRFKSTPDYISYELARNLVVFSDGFGYAYTPVPSRKFFRTNDTHGRLDWDLSPRSFLSFIVGGNYRDYEESENTQLLQNDQYRFEGSLGYNRRHSSRTTWNVRYLASKNIYKSYGSALTHSGMVGISHQLRPSVMFSFEAGPSYVTTSRSDKNYIGYAAHFRMTKTMEITQVSLFAMHRSGDSSGIGYISDTDRGGIGFVFRPIRYVNIAFNSSAYRSRQRHDLHLTLWGVDGGAQVSWVFNRFIRLGCGASYRRNEGYVTLDREYKQFYGSINLTAPEFWNTTL
ncbi:MAG: hypothetical protein P8Z37_18505 [Acidobacteriota bacterium]